MSNLCQRIYLVVAGAVLLAAPACSNDPPRASARAQLLQDCPVIGDPLGGAVYGGDCPSDGTCPLGSDGYPDCSDADCAGAPNCLDDDATCSMNPDGSARCEDPDCAGSWPCAPDGECSRNDAGEADCDDPDCATDPRCDSRCEPVDGAVDCSDPDCAGDPQCGSDGQCRVEGDGAIDCTDPDCAEAPECTGDGVCSETSPGEPDCADPDCAGAAACNSDDVCELDASGHVNCDDPDCADQRECRSDGVCTHAPGPGPVPGTGPFPGPIARLGTAGLVGSVQVVAPGESVPDCEDPDCDEEPACAPDDPPPPPPTKVITFPELLAVQHIRAFNSNDYVDEILSTEPWQTIAAAGDASAIVWVATLQRLIGGLNATANPESPWHVLSNGRELIMGAWRTGKHINDYWASKEYRSWLQMTSWTGGWRPQIKCKSGKLLKPFGGQELNGAVTHSHGYTPDPLHVTYTAGEPKTGSPWHSYTVNGANDALTWNARLEARISQPARTVSFNLLGFDAPFIYSKLKYTLRCDGTYSVEAEASNFPTVTLYVNRRAAAWRTQRGIARFLKSGSAGRMDAVGVGPTAPGAVYDTFNGNGDIVDE
jgi:hypothetical protein